MNKAKQIIFDVVSSDIESNGTRFSGNRSDRLKFIRKKIQKMKLDSRLKRKWWKLMAPANKRQKVSSYI